MLATDATTETLAVAESRVAGNNVAFRVADAYALPRTDERFNGGFAGFWISHVPKARLREFLTGLHAALTPGATVVLLDNRYVEGSSTPISERDAEGNTYQIRLLRDGTAHRILKNFPSEEEMREALDGRYSELRYTAWQYYWAIRYVIP